MATVELSFTPLPAHVRTARLVATAVARRSGVAESLLDEVRLAVGEACSRAVEAHRRSCPAEPVRLALTDVAGRFEVEVNQTGAASPGPGDPVPSAAQAAATLSDTGAAEPSPGPHASAVDETSQGAGLPEGLGDAVIAGLADDVEIHETDAGTSIRMSWPSSGLRD
jgi:serine/threonine-protein kinase RsbW